MPALSPLRLAGSASAAAALVLAVAACGSSSSDNNGGSGGSGSSVNVTAKDFSFDPITLSVPAGARVTVDFKNDGKVEHSFTLDNGGGEVEADGGGSKTLTFTAPQSGTVAFHCKYHPSQMKGTITVGGAGSGSTSSSTSDAGVGY